MELFRADTARLETGDVYLGARESQPNRLLHGQPQVHLVLAYMSEDERDERRVAHERVALGEIEYMLRAASCGELDGVLVRTSHA